jgi:hypothetical protein
MSKVPQPCSPSVPPFSFARFLFFFFHAVSGLLSQNQKEKRNLFLYGHFHLPLQWFHQQSQSFSSFRYFSRVFPCIFHLSLASPRVRARRSFVQGLTINDHPSCIHILSQSIPSLLSQHQATILLFYMSHTPKSRLYFSFCSLFFFFFFLFLLPLFL